MSGSMGTWMLDVDSACLMGLSFRNAPSPLIAVYFSSKIGLYTTPSTAFLLIASAMQMPTKGYLVTEGKE